MEYIEKTEKDNKAVSEIIKGWGSDILVSKGKTYKTEDLDGILTYDNNKIIGLGLYYIKNNECEIVLLETFLQNKGIGTQIIEKIKEVAKIKNCKRIWLITSNDNIDAIKFYQRKGFNIANIYKNAMDKSRELKPSIPLIGNYEIPIRDEIEFEIKI
jgi:N-acetylglutamate synthase-like GNAT family acetyltransferase